MASAQTVILGTDRAFSELIRIARAAPRGSVAVIAPPLRTIPQNKRMQAMLSDVARAKPDGRVLSTDHWKCLFMDALAAESGKPGFKARWEPSLDGEGVVNVGYRSSRLDKSDMGELMDFIEAWGTQKGVVWTAPADQSDVTELKREGEGL
jgi:NinB protein